MAEVGAAGTGVQAIVARRRAERAGAIDVARRYVEDLAGQLDVVAGVVFGSFARGDFNSWSDIDVLVVSDDLPVGARARIDCLWRARPGGLEPVGWTTAELLERVRRRDPIAVEAGSVGVCVKGRLPAV